MNLSILKNEKEKALAQTKNKWKIKNGLREFIILGESEFPIAIIENKWRKHQINESNAKLIAAAPELLECSERLLIDFIFSLSNQGKVLGWDNKKIEEQINAHPLVIKTRGVLKKATE